MMEKCVFCGEHGTPWQEVKGHLCFDCHINSNTLHRKCNHEDCEEDKREGISDIITLL